MYQAIVTKYLGPSNVRGSRVKATAAAGSVTLTWDDRLNPEENHIRAAQALANKQAWNGHWFGGQMADARYCFVSPFDYTDEADLGVQSQFYVNVPDEQEEAA